ncbi:Putative AC transposase [Linum perenne]
MVTEEDVENARLTSLVWQHFKRVRVCGILKAKCNYCNKLLGGTSNHGTSNLKAHTSSCFQKRIQDRSQKILGANIMSKGKKDMIATSFDASVARKNLAIAIVMHEYPLSIVDHLYFKNFVFSLQPLFSVPSRNTIKDAIMKVHVSERDRFRQLIDDNKGRIAITTDMWTASNQRKGYMAVTAQYIDNTWKLRNHMMGFIYVPAPHTSERLASVLVKCMLEWNVDNKVSTITLDNCSTNDAMLEKVKMSLGVSNLMGEGAFLHMRCSAHILNLVVKDGEDVVREGIEKIRNSVVYWIATPKRVEFFEENAKQLKFTNIKKLVYDCPTRWNSTYATLVVAIPYRDVFTRLSQRDHQYTSLPTHAHWQFPFIVGGKLQSFSEVSELFSGQNYPTANLFFPHICGLKIKTATWLSDSNQVIARMAASMWSKFSKYWEVIHQILAVAVVLDPRYKLALIEYYAEMFDDDGSGLSVESTRQILCDLVFEYQRRLNEKTVFSSLDGESTTVAPTSTDLDFDLFVSRRKKAKKTAIVTELDNYLNEEIIPRTSPAFDILMWWKVNGPKYPILHEIARDVLAIPITSVASESEFSSGGRLLDPHRSRLHHDTVEALMCTRSWLHDNHNQGNSFYPMHTFQFFSFCFHCYSLLVFNLCGLSYKLL